jgi:hypothetical protein
MTVNMNQKGCGRKRLYPHLRYYSGIYVETLEKTQKLVRIVGVPPEFRTGHLPQETQTRYSLRQLSRSYIYNSG